MSRPWWKDAVIYQIYIRSFQDSNGDGIGDIGGITSRADYLKTLGIDAIWLTPFLDSPNVDNGYDVRDYYSILTDFGTMDDWKAMLAAMHSRGIRVIMDMVVNHTSDPVSYTHLIPFLFQLIHVLLKSSMFLDNCPLPDHSRSID